MDKRGLEKEFIVGAIIAIVGFGLIFATYSKAGERISENSPEAVCRFSVVTRAATTVNVEKSVFEKKIKTLPLVCRTQDKTLKGDKEKVAKQIVDHMARCKYEFADGQYANIFLKTEVGGKADYCFPCFNIVIEGKDFDAISFEELKETLLKEKNKQITGDLSYAEYLTGYNKAPGRVQIFPQKIENKHTYTIYYSDPKSEVTVNYAQAAITYGSAGAGLGLLAGSVLGLAPNIVTVPLGAAAGAVGGLGTAALEKALGIFTETPPFPGVYLADTNEIPETKISYGLAGETKYKCIIMDDFTGR